MKRLSVGLIAASALARLVSLAGLHPLNYDEIEFYRSTKWIAQGLVPFRDFWEHHTPLQWFLFAPVAALINAPGAKAILLMRWAQVPLWIAIFWLINLWMRDAGIEGWCRWTAMVVPLTSSLFLLPAVEYRVDVLASGLMIAGMVCVQRMDRGWGYAFLAGAAFCLAGFANLRFGPLLLLAMLLARIIDFRGRGWRGTARANWIFAGAAAAFAVCALYFVITGSAGIAVRRLWTDNFLGDRLAAEIMPHMFLRRLGFLFGFSIGEARTPFTASYIDPAGIVLVLVFVLGAARALWSRRRAPDAVFYLAFVAVGNLMFVGAMKFIYTYHFLLAAVLAVPLLALEIERVRARRWIAAVIIATTCFNITVGLFRGKERDTAFQDVVMRDADRRTPPEATVLDGVGWAIRRRPAYRYWFLPLLVLVLRDRGDYENYTAEDFLRHPPGAVIADIPAKRNFVARLPLIAAHYLPTWMPLWLPAPNARLAPDAPSARWIVAQNGVYTVYASPRLATHPWFRQPLYYNVPYWRDRSLVALRPSDIGAAPVDFAVDGRPLLAQNNQLDLHRGEVLTATSRAAVPIGVMLVPGPGEERFVFPPQNVSIDAIAPPQWHVPDLSMVTRLYE